MCVRERERERDCVSRWPISTKPTRSHGGAAGEMSHSQAKTEREGAVEPLPHHFSAPSLSHSVAFSNTRLQLLASLAVAFSNVQHVEEMWTWCLTSTDTIRRIRDGEKGGRGYGGGGRGRLHTYHYTVTTRMTSALRWAAMRAILIFHDCEGQSHKTVHRPQPFEEKGEPKRIRTEVLLLTGLTPYC